MSASTAPLVILTSAVGLGVYIPAVLMQRGFSRRGADVEVEVIESYYLPQKQRSHLLHRDAQRQNFALAKMANRLARGVDDCFDPQRIAHLLAHWEAQGATRFVVWSGYWLPLLERYRRQSGLPLQVDYCHIDAAVSASFQSAFRDQPDLPQRGRDIWLWNCERQALPHRIVVADDSTGPAFVDREPALLVHGGGWGLGTYMNTLADLSRGFGLEVVVHDQEQARMVGALKGRCYMPSAGWNAWQREPGQRPEFPPMVELTRYGQRTMAGSEDHHALHGRIREVKAVVSKPGGCTLIDSLAAATPVVFLEAYSASEERNAEIWCRLGFGISFELWRDQDFPQDVLAELQANLLAARDRGTDYIDVLFAESKEARSL